MYRCLLNVKKKPAWIKETTTTILNSFNVSHLYFDWRDDLPDEAEMKTLFDDLTSIENASKQVHSSLEGIVEARNTFLEKWANPRIYITIKIRENSLHL